MADDLDQFNYLAGEAQPEDASAGEPAAQADDAAGFETEQEQQPARQAQPEPEADEKNVSLSRFKEVNEQLRRQEERVDELMRLLLQTRGQQTEQAQDEPNVDPDVEATVAPVLDKRLREYEELLRDHQHNKQMDQLEEVSPGIRALWPQIKEEYNKLPPHLRREFDNMGGAIALRARVEQSGAANTAQSASAKRRAHTEAGPVGQAARGRAPTAQDIHKMSRAEFEAFTESLRARQRGRSGEDYDSLIR